MDWISTLLVVIAAAALLCRSLRIKNNKKLPPGPIAVPILGHLHLIGKNPHQDLHKLAQKHGPIMYMRFGFVPNIVVSSPHAAEQFLKTYDLVFASRPPHEAAKYISYEQRNLSFGKYGPYWRNMRKLCTLELLSTLKINSFQSMRREELGIWIESLKQAAQNPAVIDLSASVASLNLDMTCRMIFGKKYACEDLDARGFKDVIQEAVQLIATPNLGDYFPYIGKLDIQGLIRRMKAVSGVFDAFLEKIIDEHERYENIEGKNKDFVDTLLEIMKSGEAGFQFDRRHIKAILLDMLVGAMDTSTSVIEWTFSELLKHPLVMKKLQKEMDETVGPSRMIEESDLDRMKYLEMVIKESLRIHPVGPLLIPHSAIEDCIVDGFHIPKDARIIINAWSIMRDSTAWSDPEKFVPERFEGSGVDLHGRNFQLIPFGSGRRACPGKHLGLTVVQLVVARLVHCFNWELPDGMLPNELDMSEDFGLVVARAKHLMVVPTYRLLI